MIGKLTPKRQRFVDEYLVDCNATAAAVRAGYALTSANTHAPKLMEVPAVAEAIAKGMEGRAARVQVTQDFVLGELKVLAESDISNYTVDEYGNLALVEGAPLSAWRAVSGIKRRVRVDKDGGKTYEVEVKLWDKPGSIKLVAQHLGMLTDKLDITSKGERVEGPRQIMLIAGREIDFPGA